MSNKVEDTLSIIKQYANKKTLLAWLASVSVLTITILSAIPNFMIDPSQIATTKFATKLLMTLIIGITNLICFTLIGSIVNSLNKYSEIYKARANFRTSAESILEKHYSSFKQWVERKRRPAKQKEVNIRILRQAGIVNLNYLDLEKSQLKELIKAPNPDLAEKYGVQQISKNQYKTIMAVKTGKTELKFLSPDDYLLEKTVSIGQTDEEMLINQFTKRNLLFGERISSKVLLTVVFGVTFGCIGWSTIESIEPGSADAVKQVFTIIWDILSKIATAVLSALIGFSDGGKYNDFDAGYLQIKTNVHTQYLEDKEFVPLTDKELAIEEANAYKQVIMQEN